MSYGSREEKTEIRVEVTIMQPLTGGAGVRFSELLLISPRDFDGLAAILKRFHDLFEEIKKHEEKR